MNYREVLDKEFIERVAELSKGESVTPEMEKEAASSVIFNGVVNTVALQCSDEEDAAAQADEQYKALISYAEKYRTGITVFSSYVDFLLEYSRYDDVLSVSENALKLIEQGFERNDYIHSKLLHAAALIYCKKEDKNAAEPLYVKSLKLRRELLRTADTDDNRSAVADDCMHLGDIYAERDENEKAERLYNEAASIHGALAAENPEDYMFEYGYTINRLRMFSLRLERKAAADKYGAEMEKCFMNELKRQEKFAKKNPGQEISSKYLHSVLMLAILRDHNGRVPEAIEYYEKAFGLLETMMDKYSKKYSETYAVACGRLAKLYKMADKPEKSDEMYDRLIDTFRSRFLNENIFTLDMMKKTYIRAADFFCKREKYGKSMYALEEGLSVSREMLKRNPENTEARLAENLMYNEMSRVAEAAGDNKRAVELCFKAVQLAKVLSEEHPDEPDHRLHLAEYCVELSKRYENAGETENAEAVLMDMFGIYRELADEDKEKYMPRLAGAYLKLGRFYKDSDKMRSNMYSAKAYEIASRYKDDLECVIICCMLSK